MWGRKARRVKGIAVRREYTCKLVPFSGAGFVQSLARKFGGRKRRWLFYSRRTEREVAERGTASARANAS